MKSPSLTTKRRKRGGRTARHALRKAGPRQRPVKAGMPGGAYKPLTDADLEKIHRAALEVLETVGIADATPEVIELATAKGCWISEGRLYFPPTLIEEIIANAAHEYVVYSRNKAHADVHVGGNQVNYATSGEAVTMYEAATRHYRPSTLPDLYDCCRLVDQLEHIHLFGQTVVPTELENIYEQDLNVAYALVTGTEKPCEMAVSHAKNIEPILHLFDMVLGGEGRFVKRPFVSFGGCPIVSPLRFAEESLEVLVESSKLGLICDIAIAPQAGATAPAALAGTLVQVTAEGLACLAIVNIITPGCPMTFALWPFISDLRTGAFSGGSGEEALCMAATAQIGGFYNLPTSVAAGMTDSKLPDIQAGYEKGISTVLAGLAGGNRVMESAGMLSSLMGCSLEALVIDNDMLGMAQRVLAGIEVSDETLSIDIIKEVALGAGHYLGHPQTLARMESDYLYPNLADRSTSEQWAAHGAKDMLEQAQKKVKEILSSHYPTHLDRKTDDAIRDRFPIRLSRRNMQPGKRWTVYGIQ